MFVHVWVHMQFVIRKIDWPNCFLFTAACVLLNFSQLAQSGDTVGSVSMKDDDNDNLRTGALRC